MVCVSVYTSDQELLALQTCDKMNINFPGKHLTGQTLLPEFVHLAGDGVLLQVQRQESHFRKMQQYPLRSTLGWKQY